MNDRELLELAAKAVGLKLRYNYLGGRDANQPWNPLEDDGDALRLAIELNLVIDVPSLHVYYHSNSLEIETHCKESGVHDKYAAIRRTIVRAAAVIGKQLQSLKG